MKSWRRWMAIVMVAGLAQAGLAKTEGKGVLKPGQTDAEISAALAEAIAQIDATFMNADERVQQIALLIAQTTQWLPSRSDAILGELSRGINEADLPVVSAAAIMSAGTGSPTVLQSMLDAQRDNPVRAAAVRQGATNPTAVLGSDVVTQVQPLAVRPAVAAASAPAPTPVEVATRSAIGEAPPVIIPSPPPAQPSGPPPRPPSIPYRGQ